MTQKREVVAETETPTTNPNEALEEANRKISKILEELDPTAVSPEFRTEDDLRTKLWEISPANIDLFYKLINASKRKFLDRQREVVGYTIETEVIPNKETAESIRTQLSRTLNRHLYIREVMGADSTRGGIIKED
jgi:hypothetical protein